MAQPQLWRTQVEATPDNDKIVDPLWAGDDTGQSIYIVGFVLTFDPYEQPKAGGSTWWRLVSASREGTFPYNASKVFAHFQGAAAISSPVTYAGSIGQPVFVTNGGEALRANFSVDGLLGGFVLFYLAPWEATLGATV